MHKTVVLRQLFDPGLLVLSLYNLTIMIGLISMFMLLALGQGTVEIHNSWFSVYGEPDHGRVLSEGTDQGEMTKLECSRSCAASSVCKAFQFKGNMAQLGSCVVFVSYTLRNSMIASPGNKYYEKRDCALDLPVDATVLHQPDHHCSMFSGQHVRIYKFNVVSDVIRGLQRMGHHLIPEVFPGHTTTVDAAFEMPGISPARTILLKGTKEFCYERSSSLLDLVFTKCADTNYFSTFFSMTDLDHVDTIAVYDLTNREIDVLSNGTVYRLRYSNVSGKFQLVSSFELMQVTSSNPFYNVWSTGLTAMFRLTSQIFYLFEGSKYVRYDINARRIMTAPLIVCG